MTRVLVAMVALLLSLAWPFSGMPHPSGEEHHTYSLKPTCTDSLQDHIDRAPLGTRLAVRTDCIYREQVIITKPLTLDGRGGAEIRGSDVFRGWTRRGDTWVSDRWVPEFETHGTCDDRSDGRCAWAEQVFLNGVALRQIAVGSTPEPGQFSLSAGRRVILADDPSGSVVEVTTRRYWLVLEADDTTVQGFSMKHAAVDAQFGGLQINGAENWTVRNNVLSDAHGANLAFADAPKGELLDNELFNGGQLGFGGEGDAVLVSGNFVHHNNTEAFSFDWEAGGMKITRSRGLVIERNTVFMNNGPGIWCDIDCLRIAVRDNAVHHNLGVGVFFEISDGADISGNRIWENSWGLVDREWAYESGILIASSRNANVHHNTVAWNGDGISVISQCRAHLADGLTCDPSHRWNRVYGNRVHHNTIIMADDPLAAHNIFAMAWVGDIEDAGTIADFMYEPQADNRGHDNRYWMPEPGPSSQVHFVWGETESGSLSAFNATPGEENGIHLSVIERNAALHDSGIPLQPEDHTRAVPSRAPIAWPLERPAVLPPVPRESSPRCRFS